MGGVWGLQGGSRRGGGGEFLVVVMQCLLLLTGCITAIYSYLIIGVGGMGVWGASGGCNGDLEGGGGGEFLVVVMQCLGWGEGGGSDLVCSNQQYTLYTPCSWGAVDTRAPCGSGQLYN